MSDDKTTDSGAPTGETPAIENKVKDFMNLFSQGAQFTQELLEENKRLQQRIVGMEERAREKELEPGSGNDELSILQRKYSQLKKAHDKVMAKLESIEQENHDFARRYVEIEEENNNLANLYIASFQLHSTLQFQDVVQIIMEIVINLIGAEAFAVYVYDEERLAYRPASSEGMEKFTLEDIPETANIGQAIKHNEVIIDEKMLHVDQTGLGDPLVIVPLNIGDERSEQFLFTLCCRKSNLLLRWTGNYSLCWLAMPRRQFLVHGSIWKASESSRPCRASLIF